MKLKFASTLFFGMSLYLGPPASAAPSGTLSKKDFDVYLKDCKKSVSRVNPKWDSKDIDMLCRDPMLEGQPNESKEAHARRLRLIEETEKSKKKMLGSLLDSKKGTKPAAKGSDADTLYESMVRECIKTYTVAKPKMDKKDIAMLCKNPKLEAQPGESRADRARRLRLLEETKAGAKKENSDLAEAKNSRSGVSAVEDFLKDCKKILRESDPGKDPKDIEVLCNDPDLKGKPGATYEDQVRLERLRNEVKKSNSPEKPASPEKRKSVPGMK